MFYVLFFIFRENHHDIIIKRNLRINARNDTQYTDNYKNDTYNMI